MKHSFSFSHLGRGLGLAALALVPLSQAVAAVGDQLTYSFNAASTGGAVPTVNHATLLLTETAIGVDFLLTPNWSEAKTVDNLHFVYSGDAFEWSSNATSPSIKPESLFLHQSENIDAGYKASADVIVVSWPGGNDKFDNNFSSSTWQMNGFNGSSITLADFMWTAAATADKPSPAFGVISMQSANPSNWVATVPEPETYALMLAGLGLVGFMARRRKLG